MNGRSPAALPESRCGLFGKETCDRAFGFPEAAKEPQKREGPSLTPSLVEKGVRPSIRQREAGKDPPFKPAPGAAISWAFVLLNVNYITPDRWVRRYSGCGRGHCQHRGQDNENPTEG